MNVLLVLLALNVPFAYSSGFIKRFLGFGLSSPSTTLETESIIEDPCATLSTENVEPCFQGLVAHFKEQKRNFLVWEFFVSAEDLKEYSPQHACMLKYAAELMRYSDFARANKLTHIESEIAEKTQEFLLEIKTQITDLAMILTDLQYVDEIEVLRAFQSCMQSLQTALERNSKPCEIEDSLEALISLDLDDEGGIEIVEPFTGESYKSEEAEADDDNNYEQNAKEASEIQKVAGELVGVVDDKYDEGDENESDNEGENEDENKDEDEQDKEKEKTSGNVNQAILDGGQNELVLVENNQSKPEKEFPLPSDQSASLPDEAHVVRQDKDSVPLSALEIPRSDPITEASENVTHLATPVNSSVIKANNLHLKRPSNADSQTQLTKGSLQSVGKKREATKLADLKQKSPSLVKGALRTRETLPTSPSNIDQPLRSKQLNKKFQPSGKGRYNSEYNIPFSTKNADKRIREAKETKASLAAAQKQYKLATERLQAIEKKG